MFSRVVSNFRKKTRKIAQNKSLSESISSPVLTHRHGFKKCQLKKKVSTATKTQLDLSIDDKEKILSLNSALNETDSEDLTKCDSSESGCV